jgi:pseudouridine-5'-phosphate glycosidase
LPAPIRLDDPTAIAAFVRTRGELGQTGGVLVANPILAADEIPASVMRPAIEAAIADASRDDITGKAVTPYLLSAILTKTEGRSLIANIALIKNNARLAAEIAVALAAIP